MTAVRPGFLEVGEEGVLRHHDHFGLVAAGALGHYRHFSEAERKAHDVCSLRQNCSILPLCALDRSLLYIISQKKAHRQNHVPPNSSTNVYQKLLVIGIRFCHSQ